MSTITNRTVRSILCVVILAAVAAPALAQNLEWVARWNGGTDTYVRYGNYSVATDAAGNVYAVGNPYNSSPRYDYAVVKYSPTGSLLWARTYNGPCSYGYEYTYGGLAVNDSGTVVVTGYGYEADCSGYDMVSVAWDTNGNQIWVDRYNGSGNSSDYGRAVTTDNNGNFFIFGYTYTSHSSGNNYDHVVRSFTPTGTLRWSQLYDSGDQDYAAYGKLIQTDNAGNVYYGAYSYRSASSSSYYDYRVTKYSNTGTLQWSQYYNGAGNYYDYAYGLAVDGSGNAIITGYGRPAGTNYYDYITVKYDTNGSLQWARYYDGPRGNYYDYARTIAEDGGNVYVAGYGYTNSSTSYYDYLTVAYDASGNELWEASYGSQIRRYDYAWGIAADAYGVYVTGYAYPSGSYPDMVTVVYTTGGLQQALLPYNGPGNRYDYGYSINTDGAGCFYVNGYSDRGGYVYEMTTMKYCQDVACPAVTARAGGPYVRECNGQPTSFQLDGSRSCDPTGAPLNYSWTTNCPNGYFDGSTSMRTYINLDGPPPCPVNCTADLYVSSTNGNDTDTAAITVEDTKDPWFIGVPANTTVECDSIPAPANVTAQDVCDPDVPVFYNEWFRNCQCDAEYEIVRDWDATDDCGHAISATQIITVQDTTPPVVEPAEGDLYCIKNVSHEYYCFGLDEFVPIISDNCEDNYTQQCETGVEDFSWWFEDCPSDQPDNGTGDGNTLNDCRVDPNGQWFCVRAERAGEIYLGRRYTVMVRAQDDCGNIAEPQSIGTIYIPHDSSDDKDCLDVKESPF